MQIKRTFYFLSIFALIVIFSGCSNPLGDNKTIKEESEQKTAKTENVSSNNLNNNQKNMMSTLKAPTISQELIKKYPFAVIKTNLGDIKVKLAGVETPLTVTNFLQLADSKFYDGVRFHRVIKGFMIQTGDPLSKDDAMKNRWGTGDPGYKFKDELKGTEKYPQGTVAMANSGPNTNGSQFFIVTASPQVALPASYTVFGEVVSGIDVALKIENVKTTTPDRPVENVTIKTIELLAK
ncbi:MAG: peptidylprolyl isomerase [Candidatus Moraniibacteriota bacterium]